MKHANIAYCQSIDIHLTEFTVIQHLYYACLLRLGNKLSREECTAQCCLAAEAVGLDLVLNRYVRKCVCVYLYVSVCLCVVCVWSVC
jgi:ABC-type multidrug transport system ATPase subunit